MAVVVETVVPALLAAVAPAAGAVATSGEPTLRHPTLLLVGVVACAVAVAAFHSLARRHKGRYEGGIRAANTKYAKALPEYVARRRRWRMAMAILEACCAVGMVSSVALMARPSMVLTEEGEAKKRDIFLCLDVSFSIFAQNEQLVASLKDVVRGLDGERFGITIFNSSSVMYVPMTDDYDYVLEQLDTLGTYFKMQCAYANDPDMAAWYDLENLPEADPEIMRQYKEDPEGFVARMYEIDGGVESGGSRGSSIIGEGLATCLYSFPHLEDESRTRIVILSTDNDDASLVRDVTLPEAGRLCEKHDVTVYGIMPGADDLPLGHSDYPSAKREFEGVCTGTGGRMYVAGHGQMDVDEAVSDIRSREALTIREPSKRYQIDTPMVPYVVLLASAAGMLVAIGVMRPW